MDKILNKIPLSKGYHNFADKRTYLGIPNFFNVISNIAILIPAIYFLEILVCLVQAYVFSLLSAVFIGMAIHVQH